jgi:hypothetical protein
MPRKPNYGLNKHRKEQERKARQDAKMLDRKQRRAEESQLENTTAPEPAQDAGGQPLPPDETR